MLLREEELLHAAFGELRAIERESTPHWCAEGLQAVRPPVRPMLWRPLAAAMLALFVIITCAAVLRTPTLPQTYVDTTSWKAPTDFLLDTPQSDLLRSTPRFGERNAMR